MQHVREVGHHTGREPAPAGREHTTIEDQIAEDDKVVTRWTMRDTHEGEFRGIAPTGKQISITGIGIFRFSDGKVVESWDNFDQLGMMQQLGDVPPPGGAAG